VLAAARDAARREGVELVMPRWDFGTDTDLLSALDRLGLTRWKNLPGIDLRAEVTAATHRANITVDEFGTEAAAVTAIGVELTSIFEPAVTVVADHPFAFAIVHPPTGMPLFLGQVAQPS
jgi:serine protease inhibitor